MPTPTIVHEGDGRLDRYRFMVKTSTVIERGDLLYASGGYAYALASVTGNSRFAGVAYESSSSTESASITVLNKCIIDCPVSSANYTHGEALKYSSDNTLVDDSGATAAIGWVYERATGVTRVKVLIDVLALGSKLFENADT